VRWSVRAANRDRLARWAIEHGPGIRVVSPRDVVMLADATLEEVYRAHAEHR
jgi:hypothetical protein